MWQYLTFFLNWNPDGLYVNKRSCWGLRKNPEGALQCRQIVVFAFVFLKYVMCKRNCYTWTVVQMFQFFQLLFLCVFVARWNVCLVGFLCTDRLKFGQFGSCETSKIKCFYSSTWDQFIYVYSNTSFSKKKSNQIKRSTKPHQNCNILDRISAIVRQWL